MLFYFVMFKGESYRRIKAPDINIATLIIKDRHGRIPYNIWEA